MIVLTSSSAASARTLKLPYLDRSAGISVVSSQVPLTYWKKSSPGLTDISMCSVAMPKLPRTGFAAICAVSGVLAVSVSAPLLLQAVNDSDKAKRLGANIFLKVMRRSFYVINKKLFCWCRFWRRIRPCVYYIFSQLHIIKR